MKNKKIIYIILSLILLLGVFLGIRFLSGEDNWICENGRWVKHGNPSNPPPNKECIGENKNTNSITKPTDKSVSIKDIEFVLPAGWQRVEKPMKDVDFMAINTGENTNDENSNNIGFKSYFVFVHSTSTKSLNDRFVYFKEELSKVTSDYQIENISDGLVDNNQAKFFDVNFTQYNINFKTFVALFKAKDNTIWSFTLSTTQLLWSEYSSLIPQLLNTIKFK